jgi:hypothetical protein
VVGSVELGDHDRRRARSGRVAEVPDTSKTWGKIAKVTRLACLVDEHLAAEHRLLRPRKVDEEADIKLMRELVLEPYNIVLVDSVSQSEGTYVGIGHPLSERSARR